MGKSAVQIASCVVRVLFDQNVSDKLRPWLTHHDVSVASLLGWGRLRNGELLSAAESAGFEVFLTGDRNLEYQQNLSKRSIAIVVTTRTNWTEVIKYTASIVAAIDRATPGSFQIVDCHSKP